MLMAQAPDSSSSPPAASISSMIFWEERASSILRSVAEIRSPYNEGDISRNSRLLTPSPRQETGSCSSISSFDKILISGFLINLFSGLYNRIRIFSLPALKQDGRKGRGRQVP